MPPHFREVWLYLVANANHTNDEAANIKRGELYRTYEQIAEHLSWYEGFIKKRYATHQIRSAMVWLRERAMVATRKSTRGNLITICKYDSYQDATQMGTRAGILQDSRRSSAINKNANNVKEENTKGGDEVSKHYNLNNAEHLKIIFDQATAEEIAMHVNMKLHEMRKALEYWIDDRTLNHRNIDTLAVHRAGFRNYLRNSRDRWKAPKAPKA